MNSQYEINLRESTPLDAADRAFRLKSRGEGRRRAARPASPRSWASRSTTRAARASTSTSRSAATATTPSPTTTTRDGVADRAAPLHRRRAGARPGADGLPEPDRQRLPADPAPTRLAPTHANWGWDNRTTFVRIPPERGGGDAHGGPRRRRRRQPVPRRSPRCCSPACDGVRRELDRRRRRSPATPTRPPRTRPARRCRRSLERRARRARGRRGASRDAIGPEIVDTFLAIKRFELERHRG